MAINAEMARIIDAIVAMPEASRREILSLFEPDGKLKKFEAKIHLKLGDAAINRNA